MQLANFISGAWTFYKLLFILLIIGNVCWFLFRLNSNSEEQSNDKNAQQESNKRTLHYSEKEEDTRASNTTSVLKNTMYEESKSDVTVIPPGNYRQVDLDTLKSHLTPDDADVIYDKEQCTRALYEARLNDEQYQNESVADMDISDIEDLRSDIFYNGSLFDNL